jgi:3-methyl-2-oxobutanoate hydroxymethyltransferase
VPEDLAADISSKLDIPVIGIGAGAGTDAQVLVLHDLLGLTEKPAKFVENFMASANTVQDAISAFVNAVKDGSYPQAQHTYR